MKKFMIMMLSGMMAVSLAACGGGKTPAETEPMETIDMNQAATPESGGAATPEMPALPPESESGEAGVDVPAGNPAPVELLNTIWASYSEDELFPAMGGDTNPETLVMDAPGSFTLADAAVLDSTLGFPAADVAKIDGAASLIHMMNANTFTGAAYHLVDASSASSVADAIQTNLANRQWICGFPDKMAVAVVDDCVVSVFGAAETVDTFIEKMIAAYPDVEMIVDEPIA